MTAFAEQIRGYTQSQEADMGLIVLSQQMDSLMGVARHKPTALLCHPDFQRYAEYMAEVWAAWAMDARSYNAGRRV